MRLDAPTFVIPTQLKDQLQYLFIDNMNAPLLANLTDFMALKYLEIDSIYGDIPNSFVNHSVETLKWNSRAGGPQSVEFSTKSLLDLSLDNILPTFNLATSQNIKIARVFLTGAAQLPAQFFSLLTSLQSFATGDVVNIQPALQTLNQDQHLCPHLRTITSDNGIAAVPVPFTPRDQTG